MWLLSQFVSQFAFVLLNHWYIIHPFSKLRVFWERLMIIVLFVNLIEIPFNTAFYSRVPHLNMWPMLNTICDLICLIDVVINFFTGYHECATKEIVLEPKRIARHYLTSYFFIDLISSLPLGHIIIVIESGKMRLPIVNCISMLKIFRTNSLLRYTSSLVEHFQVKYTAVRIVRVSLISMFFFHWWACIQFLVPVITRWRNLNGYKHSWVMVVDIENKSLTLQYANSMLRTVCNTVKFGYGHSAPTTLEDMAVTTINIISGAILYAYIIVVMIHIMTSDNSSETKYQEIMNQLQQYMTHKRLTHHLQRRLFVYYEHRFQNNYFRESAILASLSNHLREEILLHCCQRLVENVVIFSNLPKIVVNIIIKCLKHEIYLLNDVVMKANLPGDCMYFISSGTVAVYTPMGKEVCHLDDNCHFGEVALVLEDDRRTASIVAVETCELYRLDRKDFQRVIMPFPDLMTRIEQIAIERVKATLLIEEEHKRLLLETAMHQENNAMGS